jgi:hypothetical protein
MPQCLHQNSPTSEIEQSSLVMDTLANLLYVLLLTCTLAATAPTQSQQDNEIQVDAGSLSSKPGNPSKDAQCTDEHKKYTSVVLCGDHLEFTIECSEEVGNKEFTVISYTCTKTDVKLGGEEMGDRVVVSGTQRIWNGYASQFIQEALNKTSSGTTQKPSYKADHGRPQVSS